MKVVASGYEFTADIILVPPGGDGIVALSPIRIALLEDEEQRAASDPNNHRHESGSLEHILGRAEDVVQFTKSDQKIFQLQQTEDTKHAEYRGRIGRFGHPERDAEAFEVPRGGGEKIDNAVERRGVHVGRIQSLERFPGREQTEGVLEREEDDGDVLEDVEEVAGVVPHGPVDIGDGLEQHGDDVQHDERHHEDAEAYGSDRMSLPPGARIDLAVQEFVHLRLPSIHGPSESRGRSALAALLQFSQSNLVPIVPRIPPRGNLFSLLVLRGGLDDLRESVRHKSRGYRYDAHRRDDHEEARHSRPSRIGDDGIISGQMYARVYQTVQIRTEAIHHGTVIVAPVHGHRIDVVCGIAIFEYVQ
mmetsp:Transcript_4499/g.12508  ORF Transcript_4499/g.12508 Transcript_4499/m.12508 type:complete len:361 (+) Transcript_4499:424-1506(+)